MVVHRDQAEQVVVGLGHGLRRPVLVDGADLELLQVAAVRMGAAGLARGLIGLEGLRLAWLGLVALDGLDIAHGGLRVSFWPNVRRQL